MRRIYKVNIGIVSELWDWFPTGDYEFTTENCESYEDYEFTTENCESYEDYHIPTRNVNINWDEEFSDEQRKELKEWLKQVRRRRRSGFRTLRRRIILAAQNWLTKSS